MQELLPADITPQTYLDNTAVGRQPEAAHVAVSSYYLGLDDKLQTPIHQKIVEELTNAYLSQAADSEKAVLNAVSNQKSRNQFATRITELKPPQFLYDVHKASTPEELVGNLLDESAESNMRGSVNFFEWYRAALGERQRAFDEQKPEFLARFSVRIQSAADEGIVPASSVDIINKLNASSDLIIRIADWSLMADRAGATATFNNGTRIIDIEPTDDLAWQEHMLTHELLHVASAPLASIDTESIASLTNSENNGLGRLLGKTLGAKVLNEAVTEHTAEVLISGNVEVTNPLSNERNTGSEPYIGARCLLDVLCNHGLETISPVKFIHVMLESDSNKYKVAEQELVESLDRSFPGMNVLSILKSMDDDSDTSSIQTAVNISRQVGAVAQRLVAEAHVGPSLSDDRSPKRRWFRKRR